MRKKLSFFNNCTHICISFLKGKKFISKMESIKGHQLAQPYSTYTWKTLWMSLVEYASLKFGTKYMQMT